MFSRFVASALLLCAISLSYCIIIVFYDDSCDRRKHLISSIVYCVICFLILFVFTYLALRER